MAAVCAGSRVVRAPLFGPLRRVGFITVLVSHGSADVVFLSSMLNIHK